MQAGREHLPTISALGKLRQEGQASETSVGYILWFE